MIAWFLFYILRESNVHGSVRPSGKWTDPDDQIYGGLLKSSQRMSKPIRIPIKYQKGVFSDLELNLIKHALDDLRDSLNGCVQFFDIDIYIKQDIQAMFSFAGRTVMEIMTPTVGLMLAKCPNSQPRQGSELNHWDIQFVKVYDF